ncbi:RNA-guided endonuclease TnpB family protein [Okeania sp. KiyG1]|uniref:RNA-guided endonuclease InsQ/TnpB family protein n=1 Tax=Okeania sp. KiyG1 TaxID=2720165 RepID=UPI001923A7F7|nr:RNA-guided endonuclease TnpB family protein [Okeania sp. KiyG1]GGA08106.1 transposase [Okeania sp. KiyG1]
MFRAYKYRIYPNTEQLKALAKSFGCCRWFWNYSLNLCQETYQKTGKGLSRSKIQGLLPNLKKQNHWLKEDVYSQCLQVVALNLSTAYKNFFEKKARYPRFKSKHGKQSISYPQNVKFEGDYLKLPKIGLIYCVRHREFDGKIKTVSISKNSDGKYYASILVDDGEENPKLSSEGKAIGIDLGLTHFAITSDGSKYDNPRHIRKHERNLKRKQKNLSRKQKGSKNRNKARKKVAKIHSKISRSREDFLHKLSRAAVATTGGTPATRCLKIVNENQVIVLENLAVKNMIKNHNLAKAISDCGWGMFGTMLNYKAEREGKIYLEIDRFFPSSKTCHICLNQVGSLPLNVRTWTCKHCQTTHDRDTNAAINILKEGLRKLSLGTSDTALRGNVSRVGKTSVLSNAIPNEEGSLHYIPCD